MSLLDGLVAYWEMEAAANADEPDVIGSSTLVAHTTIGSVAGAIGNARHSGGSNSLRAASNSAIEIPAGGDFTVLCYVNPDSPIPLGLEAYVAAKWDPVDSPNLFEWKLSLQDNGTDNTFTFPVFAIGSGGSSGSSVVASMTSTAAVFAGTWDNFILAWYDSSLDTINIQVKGGSGSQQSAPGNGGIGPTSGLTLRCFQTSGGGTDFIGSIDELGIWKRVLTASERDLLFNNGAGLPFSQFGGVATTYSDLLSMFQ